MAWTSGGHFLTANHSPSDSSYLWGRTVWRRLICIQNVHHGDRFERSRIKVPYSFTFSISYENGEYRPWKRRRLNIEVEGQAHQAVQKASVCVPSLVLKRWPLSTPSQYDDISPPFTACLLQPLRDVCSWSYSGRLNLIAGFADQDGPGPASW